MRMLRLSLAGAASLALLAGLGVVVVAQDDGASDPGYTLVSGTTTAEQWHADAEQSWEEDGVLHSRDTVGEWTVEWSDRRLPSKMWHRIDYEGYGTDEPDGGVTPYATSVLLVDDQGSWVGTGRGVGYGKGFVQMVLVGQDAYEGLYAIIDRHGTVLPNEHPMRLFEGFIFEGELTPMPDAVEPAAE
jgi:hypothetical protein